MLDFDALPHHYFGNLYSQGYRSTMQQEFLSKHKDQKLIVAKQRHSGGWEGTYNFYFHDNSLQLTEQEDRPRRFYFNTVVDKDI